HRSRAAPRAGAGHGGWRRRHRRPRPRPGGPPTTMPPRLTLGGDTGRMINDIDLGHLRRCVELAREALEDGDEPFGSVLVDAAGEVRLEDRNRVKGGDHTRHPELEI